MKIKCRPDDFRVEELTAVQPSGGPFAFYRLSKQSMGTPEAVEAILRRWNIARQRLATGGLKDRHASTIQYLTIHRGPRQNLRQSNFELEYLGQVARPFGPNDIEANRFDIVLRDLDKGIVDQRVAEIERIGSEGVPNYFDDQRFGSVGISGDFIALPWCQSDYQRALWLALAEANRHDRPDEREQKRILRELWACWAEAKEALARSHRRSVVTYLMDHPTDFRRAFALIRVDLRRLYLAAFQSHLWNQILSQWLKQHISAERLVDIELGAGRVSTWTHLSADEKSLLESTYLPLPTARNQNLPEDVRELVQSVVRAAGLELRELRVKYPRDSFFSKGNRAALLRPRNVSAQSAHDQLYPGRYAIAMQMELARGCYATMVLKQLRGEQEP